MSETEFICSHCQHSFSMLAVGAQSISCPGCGHQFEFPSMRGPDGRAVRVTDRLAGVDKDFAALNHQLEELKRSLETSKHRASDRRLMVADQQKKLNSLQQERVKMLQEIERLKKGAPVALPPQPAEPTVSKDLEVELQRTKNELQLTRVESLRHQGTLKSLTQERDELLQKLREAEIALADARHDIASSSLSAESERVRVLEEHFAKMEESLSSAESERTNLREQLQQSEAQHTSTIEASTRELENLRASLEATENEKNKALKQVAEAEALVEELTNAKERAEAETKASGEVIEILNQDLQNLQEDIRKASDQVRLHQQQVLTAESALAQTKSSLETAQNQIRTLRVDRDEATNAAAVLRTDLANANEEIERTKRHLTETTISLEKLEAENRQLRDEINSSMGRTHTSDASISPGQALELRAENEEIRNQLVETRIELLKLKEQFVLAQGRSTALQSELAAKEKELGAAKSELAHADREYDRISEQHQEVKQHYLMVNQKLEASKKEVAALKDKISEMSDELEELNKALAENAEAAAAEPMAIPSIPPPPPIEKKATEPILKNPQSGGFLKTFRLIGRKEGDS